MAIKVPGDPFVDVRVGAIPDAGLQAIKESPLSARHSFAGLSATTMKAMEQIQEDIDETVTRDNLLALNQAADDMLNNKDTGFLQRKGKNALELVNGRSITEQAQDELKRRYDTIAKGAYNQRQQHALSKFYGNLSTNVQQKLSAHVIKQQAVYKADERSREADQAMRMALGSDSEQIESGLLILRRLSEEIAQEQGTEVDYTETLGKVQAMRISAMLDAENIEGARALLKAAKDDMSAADYHRSSRLVTVAAKHKAKAGQIADAEKFIEDTYSDYSIASSVIKETYGKSIGQEEFELAMTKSGGDPKLAAQIAFVGVDAWDTVDKETQARAQHVGDMFSLRSSDFSKQSAQDLVPVIMKHNPKMEYEDAVKASKNVVAKRYAARMQAQQERDTASRAVFDAVRGGVSIDKMPQDLRDALPKDTLTDIQTYQERAKTNSLVTNPALYWELSTDTDRLKGMTDEAFVRVAKDLSPEKYAELTRLRAGLRSGQYDMTPEAHVRRMVADVIKDFGIKMPSGESGKAVNGYLLELLTKKIQFEQATKTPGNEVDRSDVEATVRKFMKTEFTTVDGGWGWLDDSKSGAALLRGERLGTSDKLGEILDAGITAVGNYEPNEVSRQRVLMSMFLTPSAPIDGSEAMVEAIDKQKSSAKQDIVNAYRRKHGGRTPSNEYIIRAYFAGNLKHFQHKEQQ